MLSSWEGPNGELRVHGVVTDAKAEKDLRSGATRELSLGTSVHSEEHGRVLMRTHDELSLCERAARPGVNRSPRPRKNLAMYNHSAHAHPSLCAVSRVSCDGC